MSCIRSAFRSNFQRLSLSCSPPSIVPLSSCRRIPPSYRSLRNLCLQHKKLYFSTSCRRIAEEQTDKNAVMVRVFEQGKTLPHQQWIMRMNNQNGYLSWCRNSYICLSITVAVSMSPLFLPGMSINGGQTSLTDFTYTMSGLAMLSMGNMLFGSIEFLYQSFRTRKLTQISWPALCIYTVFAVLHALLFCDFVYTVMQTFSDSETLDMDGDNGGGGGKTKSS